MRNLLRLKKLVYKVARSHLGGLELAFPLHFTPFRLAPPSVTASAIGSSLFLLPSEAVKMAGFALLSAF